jgi:uncharacterized membrane protein (DUF4010 family)
MSSGSLQLLERLCVALAIGLLIGLERGWEYRQLPEGSRVAGLRTFGLISLLGASTIQIGPAPGLFACVALLCVAALMGLGYWRDTVRESSEVSIATPIAALVTFALGAFAGIGKVAVAASVAVVVTLVLEFRAELHSLVFKMERQELTATTRLLLISVVLLPILPDRGIGPWAAFNPYQMWWMVVMIAAISYVGYFAMKALGEERGLLMTGLFGGFLSSTAVTLTLSPRARTEESRNVVAAAILFACAIMFPRILIIVAFVAPALLQGLAAPLGAAAVLSFASAFFWARRTGTARTQTQAMASRNPLDLWFAVRFGALLALIMFAARAAHGLFGARGLYVVAAISGVVDVDAITLSLSSMVNQGQVRMGTAIVAILIPAAVNTLVKPSLMTLLAGSRAAIKVWIPLCIALAAGAAVWWQLN